MPERDVAPIFSDYKYLFAIRRWTETCFGGVRLFTSPDNERVSCVVVLIQLILLLLPCGIAVVCLLVMDDTEDNLIRGVLCGGSLFVITCMMRVLSRYGQRMTPDLEKGLSMALQDENLVDLSSFGGKCRFMFDESEAKFVRFVLCRSFVAFALGFVVIVSAGNSSGELRWLILPAFGMAQYSLYVRHPTELSQWRGTEHPLDCLNRAFHVILLCSVTGLKVCWLSVLLPVIWALGLISTMDAIVEWSVEQVVVYGFGGTTAASSWRLVKNTIITIVVMCITGGLYFATSAIKQSWRIGFVHGIAGVSAYILSRGAFFMISLPTNKRKGVFPIDVRQTNEQIAAPVNIPHECVSVVLVFIIAYTASIVTIGKTVLIVVLSSLLVLSLLLYLVRSSQKPFVVFGVFRSSKRLARLNDMEGVCCVVLRLIRGVLLFCIFASSHTLNSPFVSNYLTDRGTLCGILFVVFLIRAIRVSVSNTLLGIFECLISVALSDSLLSLSPVVTRMALVGFVVSRVIGFFSRMQFIWIHLFTSLRSKKLRLKPWPKLVSIACFPTVDVIAAIAGSILDSPVIPVLGVPIFLPGFPRPKRLWPSVTGSGSSDTAESTYYAQVYPHILRALPGLLRKGIIQPSRFGGSMYLLRFEKMIAWVTFLEVEYGYAVVYIKGLELQEPTSCHNVEANALDSFIEASFASKCNGSSSDSRIRETACSWLARGDGASPIGTLVTPLLKHELLSYSHSNVSLTGVIDSPDFLRLVDQAFLYSLVWHFRKNSSFVDDFVSDKSNKIPTASDHVSNTLYPFKWDVFCKDGTKQGVLELEKKGPAGPAGPLGDDFDMDAILGGATVEGGDDFNIDALLDEIDDERLEVERVVAPTPMLLKKQVEQVATPVSSRASSRSSASNRSVDATQLVKMLDSAFDDAPGNNSIRSPKESSPPPPKFEEFSGVSGMLAQAFDEEAAAEEKERNNVKHSMITKGRESDYAKKYQSSPRKDRPNSILNMLDSVLSTESEEAQQQVRGAIGGLRSDKTRVEPFENLVLYSYALINVLGLGGQKPEKAGAIHVIDCFNGKFPKSMELKWLSDKPKLFALIMASYRSAFKLAMDALLLGDPDMSLTDFTANDACLSDYENNWYIGCQKDANWNLSLRAERKHLVSLVQNPKKRNTAGVLQLSLQHEKVSICHIKSQVALGFWASLAMELFYFTNDDDERYSIQAHQHLLRNLIIQSANPPLGYPVFISAPKLFDRRQ